MTRYDRKLPEGSKTFTTVCQFCAVGCGYRAVLIPEDAGELAQESADSVDAIFPAFLTPSMKNQVQFDGKDYSAAVFPDARCDLNRGNHSVRGGTQALNLVNPNGSNRNAKERLISPQIRCSDGKLHEVSWKIVNQVIAKLTIAATRCEAKKDDAGKFVITPKRPQGLGVKIFEYQFLENTYAATKLFFRAIGTPNVAFHDRPSVAGSSPGLADAGFPPHAFGYRDVRHADVIFLAGSNPYENQSVFFMQNCAGKELIVLDPRRTATAQYAVDTGGIHLQPKRLGADSLVLYALARAILECQSENNINSQVARSLNDSNIKKLASKGTSAALRRASRAMGLEQFKKWLGIGDSNNQTYTLENAAKVSGIPLGDLQKTVRWLTNGAQGSNARGSNARGSNTQRSNAQGSNARGSNALPLVALLYEKGLIWGFNYHNTAAIASLGLTLYRPEQPAPLTGRCGGHQKGWAVSSKPVDGFQSAAESAGYPFSQSTDFYSDPLLKALKNKGSKGRIKVEHNLDSHVFGPDPTMNPQPAGKGRVRLDNQVETNSEPSVELLWIIGNNYLGQTNNAQWKRKKLQQRIQAGGEADPLRPDSSDLDDVDRLTSAFLRRMKESGLVVIHQELFPNATTELSDIVLPAAGWGEENFVRYNAERRLRLYERFQDSPIHPHDEKLLKKNHHNLASRDALQHSPKPDWLIFQSIAREMIQQVSGCEDHSAINEFDWSDSSAIADEMASHSNRTSMLGDLIKFAEIHKLHDERTNQHTRSVHSLLGLQQNGEAPLLTEENGYTVPDGSDVLSNGVASNGVMLPVQLNEQGTLSGTVTQRTTDPLNFVRADWCDIEKWFNEINATAIDKEPVDTKECAADKQDTKSLTGRQKSAKKADASPELESTATVILTCGRVNHLWNNQFSSSRGEFVVDRYPDDLPGTILELNPTWARQESIQNGSILNVANSAGSFKAVASLQDSVAFGQAFGIFSYPVRNEQNEFVFDGYVNNVMHGYWDGINPIGALKYGQATVSPTGEIFHSENHRGPIYDSRNQIVSKPVSADLRSGVEPDQRWTWFRRIDWRMRELIVAKGLPRAFVHSGERRQASMLDPDRAFADIRNHWGAVFTMMLDAMQWPPPSRDPSRTAGTAGRYDKWDGGDLDFARSIWGRSLELPDETQPEAEKEDKHSCLKQFIIWSEFLTGFDDLHNDPSFAKSILQRLIERYPKVDFKSLLSGINQNNVKRRAFQNQELAEVNIILWYTGTFVNSFGFAAEDYGPLKNDHYRRALMWKAAGIQPQGYSTSLESWESIPKPDSEPLPEAEQ